MSLTQERINEIALECWQKAGSTNPITLCNRFLSRIREEQKAVSHDDPRADEIVSGLYRKFKEWSNRKFSADDVTWCEVKGEINKLISIKFTIPPAASDCKELVEALEIIYKWDSDIEIPTTSNRDSVFNFYRNIAGAALAKHKASMGEE